MVKYSKIAFLFPGQGAQYPGMGKDFVEQFSTAREIYQQADDILHRKLSSIILQGPVDVLTETRNSQAGIYVMSCALLKVLKDAFPFLNPYVCAGLSLGEYTALTAAGWLSMEEGLPLVDRRGSLMNDACLQSQGAMAVVMGLGASEVEEMVKEINMPHDLWAANFNCPGQVVISGTMKGIEAGSAAAKAKGAKRVLPLQVQGAFHSGLMRPAREKLAPYIRDAHLAKTDVKMVMNVPGAFVEDINQAREDLIAQVTQPVRWEQGIRAMAQQGVELFIEIGCGKTLSGMNKRMDLPGEVKTLSIETIKDFEILAEEL